jgi:hypothetical protein
MAFNDLITLYFERSNAYISLWGFYITVVLGLLAYFGTAKQSRQKIMLAVVVSFGFVGFAVVNGNALSIVAHELIVTRQLIADYPETEPEKEKTVTIRGLKTAIPKTSLPWLTGFHIGSDVMVLIGIWMLTAYPGKGPVARETLKQ